MRNYSNLSDHDFEMLIADLLGAELSCRFERFARGADCGIDLRSPLTDDGRNIVQCKHYVRSSITHLLSAADRERERLMASPPFARLSDRDHYWFVTSASLTPEGKHRLASTLSPFITSTDRILGLDDIEGLLDAHPQIERRQIKLWIDGWGQLDAVLHAGRHQRSRALLDEIGSRIKRYVPPSIYSAASRRLAREHVLVVAGAPGIGKTTLAHMLTAEAAISGFQIVEVVSDIEEAWSAYEPSTQQFFYYDDFLGRTTLQTRLGKNEDSQIVRFMQVASRNPNTRFVLTTREHILQDALTLHERLAQYQLAASRILIALTDYSFEERARIVTGHIEAAPVTFGLRSLFRATFSAYWRSQYWDILLHRNFNPRHIEWICGLGPYRHNTSTSRDFYDTAISALNDPSEIWAFAFETELTDAQRLMTLVASTLPRRFAVADLEVAWDAACRESGLSTGNRGFERCLAVLDGTVFATQREGNVDFCELTSPGIEDFARQWIRRSPADALNLIRSATFFEQVVSLWESLCLWDEAPQDRYLKPFVEASERTYDLPTSTWLVTEAPTGEQRASRAKSDERQLVALNHMRRGRDDVADAFSDVWNAKVRDIFARWRGRREGATEDVLRCAQMLAAVGEVDSDTAEVIRTRVVADLSLPEHFLGASKLRKIDESIFSPESWQSVQDRLLEVVELGSWSDVEVAECLDVVIYDRHLDDVLFPGGRERAEATPLDWQRDNHAHELFQQLTREGVVDRVDGIFRRLYEREDE